MHGLRSCRKLATWLAPDRRVFAWFVCPAAPCVRSPVGHACLQRAPHVCVPAIVVWKNEPHGTSHAHNTILHSLLRVTRGLAAQHTHAHTVDGRLTRAAHMGRTWNGCLSAAAIGCRRSGPRAPQLQLLQVRLRACVWPCDALTLPVVNEQLLFLLTQGPAKCALLAWSSMRAGVGDSIHGLADTYLKNSWWVE